MVSVIHQSFFFSSIFYLCFFINLVFSKPTLDPSKQVDHLLELKGNLRNTTFLDATWKKGSIPCKDNWIGVFCDKNKEIVTQIRLDSRSLSGDFSVESLKGLESIRAINISNNLFTGPLPDFWILGQTLKVLDVSHNKFCHPLKPDAFRKMSRLRKLDLSWNSMYGNIPESLTTLPMLGNLNLAHNLFSGNVPVFPLKSLKSIGLSYNKLEGHIPDEMTTFDRAEFDGNPGLCCKKMGIVCQKELAHKSKLNTAMMSWIILSIIIGFLVLTLIVATKMNYDNNNKKNKKSLMFKKVDDEVHIEAAVMTSRSCATSLANSSRKGSMSGRSLVEELIIVNNERCTFGLPDLMKATAEVLGNTGIGSAYKAKMSNGASVVVRRLTHMNKLSKDDFDNGIRFLGGLRHKNILPLLAYYYRNEDKLIVSEYVPRGSLMYLLHGDGGKAHAQLTWPIRLKIVKGVTRGLGFLHSQLSECDLPHGNLKSCNILLSEDFEPLLNDYTFSHLVNDTHIAQTMFAYRSPEAIFDGKVSPKSDVYCLGIVILEILTGQYPAHYLKNRSGGTDVVQWSRSAVAEGREMGLIDPEIIAGMEKRSSGEMEKLLQIGVACTLDDPDSRFGIDEAIRRIEDIQESTC